MDWTFFRSIFSAPQAERARAVCVSGAIEPSTPQDDMGLYPDEVCFSEMKVILLSPQSE
jgi:hypothetical protein